MWDYTTSPSYDFWSQLKQIAPGFRVGVRAPGVLRPENREVSLRNGFRV